MSNPVRHTAILLLLLSVSAALLLGPNESAEPRDVTSLLPKTGNKPLTALVRPETQVLARPTVLPKPIAAPMPLASPIPLPPTVARRISSPTPRPSRKPATRTIRMLVTAYCPCKKCCGKFSDNVTANGKSIYANRSMFVAADTRLLKFGTMISIPGYRGGRSVPVWDRGGKIKGRRIDVFYLSHSQARKWGRRHLDVKVSLNNR